MILISLSGLISKPIHKKPVLHVNHKIAPSIISIRPSAEILPSRPIINKKAPMDSPLIIRNPIILGIPMVVKKLRVALNP